MSTVQIHTEFQSAFDLDPAALAFLSAMYYQQKQNDCRPVSLTQNHIENMTGVGIYAQRRVRKTLNGLGLISEKRKVELVDDQGYRTKMYYNIDCQRLDSLLGSVEAKKAGLNPQQEKQKIESATAGDVKESAIEPVKMNLEWLPEDEALASYLAAYDIDSRFAVYDVLPEFVEYWVQAGNAFLPVQWQAKFHAAVRHQWQGEMNRQRNQAKVLQASDLKANAIATLKAKEAKALHDKADKIGGSTLRFDRSWADGLDNNLVEGL